MFTSVSAPASTAHSSDSFCLSPSGHLLDYWQKTDIVLCSCGKLISREPAESSPCSNRHVSCLGCDSEQRAASTNHHHATANRADAELVAKSIVQDFVYRHAFLSVLWICVLECTLSAGKCCLLLSHSPSHAWSSIFGSWVTPPCSWNLKMGAGSGFKAATCYLQVVLQNFWSCSGTWNLSQFLHGAYRYSSYSSEVPIFP